MPSVFPNVNQAVSLGACLLILLLPACSSSRRPAATSAAPAQKAPPLPDLRFPPDTLPQASNRPGEWLFWVIPAGGNAGAACHARAASEFNAKAAAHTQCATLYGSRTYYSVGGCSMPQQLAYATSADGNFTWRVCADARGGAPEAAQAEAIRLCESKSGQTCAAGRL